jgi:hypothetical protein
LVLASKWLHEGEQGAIGIYRRPRTPLFIGLAVVALSPALLARPVVIRFVFASLVLVMIGVGILCWFRDAAILTPTFILFRPVVGRPFEIPLGGVKRVTRVELPGGEAGWIEIYRLELLVGGYFDVPSGYLGQHDLSSRVMELVASTSTTA